MKHTRRGFLSILAAIAAAAVLPEPEPEYKWKTYRVGTGLPPTIDWEASTNVKHLDMINNLNRQTSNKMREQIHGNVFDGVYQ